MVDAKVPIIIVNPRLCKVVVTIVSALFNGYDGLVEVGTELSAIISL